MYMNISLKKTIILAHNHILLCTLLLVWILLNICDKLIHTGIGTNIMKMFFNYSKNMNYIGNIQFSYKTYQKFQQY